MSSLTEPAGTLQATLARARAAQRQWSSERVQQRLQIVRRFRFAVAADTSALAETVPNELAGMLHRSTADTLVAEVLPLLEACRFLEREAAFTLARRRESTTSRPVWLGGVSVETRRDPLGLVLVIGPGNYPLFLPGVQALQALVAGNAVLWKPAPGGTAAALAVQRMLVAAGLDPALLTILGTDPLEATAAMRAGVDKVLLTGSAVTGRAVMRELAETLTPSTMELSGCDAVFVLEGADLDRVTEALLFALRFNGSATCMAPRRLLVTAAVAERLTPRLETALAKIEPVPATDRTRAFLSDLVEEATLYGAKIVLSGLNRAPQDQGRLGTTLLTGVTPEMRIAQADLFAPVLSILRADDAEAAIAAHNACPYSLTAAIFGPPRAAEALAARLHAGTVLINDLIIPTADPRASFGGRGQSGFGVTRGREGLLSLTTPKTILRQADLSRSRSRRAYQQTGPAHLPFFASFAQALHAGSWRARLEGAKKLVRAAGHLKQP